MVVDGGRRHDVFEIIFVFLFLVDFLIAFFWAKSVRVRSS